MGWNSGHVLDEHVINRSIIVSPPLSTSSSSGEVFVFWFRLHIIWGQLCTSL